MTHLILGSEPRAELESLASHSRVAKEQCRALALLRLDEGETGEQVADFLHVSRQTDLPTGSTDCETAPNMAWGIVSPMPHDQAVPERGEGAAIP